MNTQGPPCELQVGYLIHDPPARLEEFIRAVSGKEVISAGP